MPNSMASGGPAARAPNYLITQAFLLGRGGYVRDCEAAML